ncbi:acetolactate synthase small subunit [Chlamydiota bacterium]
MKHVISILVENRFGVLSRISGLFSGRGFNIDSLAVGETQDPCISRMTITVKGDDAILEQIKKQLNKLIDVIKVQDFNEKEYLERELLLVEISVSPKTRPELMNFADIFKAKIVNVTPNTVTIEIVGDNEKLTTFLDLVKPYGIKELVRTGKIAISRKEK